MSIFSFTAKTDGVDDHLAAHVNNLQGAADVLSGGVQGVMYNGYIAVSVASNDLTVAIKTLAGADPSANDPVIFRIGNTLRMLTAALSVTKNDGTNWCNAGAAELATKEIDYFVYIIWNTTPATDILDIGFSRIPTGRIYSDFSGTSTNEKYLASSNASAPNGANEVEVIGRFNAILSAGASYNWSLPAAQIVVSRPIFETRAMDWVPQWTNLTVGNGTVTATYKISGGRVFATISVTWGSTTSIGGVVDATFPFARLQTSLTVIGAAVWTDTGTSAYLGGVRYISATVLRLIVGNASGTYESLSTLSSTIPFTWTTSDLMNMEYQYDI